MTDDENVEGAGYDRDAGSTPLRRRELLVAGTAGLAGCSSYLRDDGSRQPTEAPADTEETMTDPTPEDLDPQLRFAPPDEVRSTLEEAMAASGRSKVHLFPETTYRPTETWEIGPGVTLDYNGATVRMGADVDLHDVHPDGQVRDPVVDLRAVPGSYESSVFRFDSETHGFYGDNRAWHVRGGQTRGRTGEGTLFEFAQGGETAIYFVHVDHSVRHVGTVVDMHRADGYGINGVRVHGVWFGFERGIHMHHDDEDPADPVDNLSGNHFDVIAQPTDGTEILWDQEIGGFNVLQGRFWDFDQYDDVLWRIHDGNLHKRYGNIFRWFPVGGRKDWFFEQYEFADRFDDQVGDPRNRVVVPWFQGNPISDFV